VTEEELTELHFITAILNVPSILQHGILSHNEIKQRRLEHVSVAMQEIQDRRDKVTVPGNRKLHDFTNLYFNARNPMMFTRQEQHRDLCVLRISKSILRERGVVISDRNASGGYARFAAYPDGLLAIDCETVFARSWNHPDDFFAHWRHKAAMCAEVLVPIVAERIRCVTRRHGECAAIL
jgi:hypothetical protein